MKNKYLNIKSQNNSLPYLSLVNGKYIFISDLKNPKRKKRENEKEGDSESCFRLFLIASIIDNKYQLNKDGIIEEHHPYYKHYHVLTLLKKCFNWQTIYLEKGILIQVKVKRYQYKMLQKIQFKQSIQNLL